MTLSTQTSARDRAMVHLTHPVVLACLAAVSLLLGLSGPFSTLTLLPVGPRLLYWTFVICANYASGTFVTETMTDRLGSRRIGFWATGAVIGLTNGVIHAAVMVSLNTWLFGDRPHPLSHWYEMWGFVTLVALLTNYIHLYNDWSGRPAQPAERPALLDRIRPELRGDLISLSVEDHYVIVTTTRGQCRVLVRLRDAIRETAPVAGLQIHRSHWVALNRIVEARGGPDRLTLLLSDGRQMPVSRPYRPAIAALGLAARTPSGANLADPLPRSGEPA